MANVHMVCAIAAHKKLALCTVDIDSAYLHGKIDAKVYMEQPPGYADPAFPDTTKYVLLFIKGLYRLKQSRHLWHIAITGYITNLRFKRIDGDLCVYVRNNSHTIIALHVDDFLCTGKNVNLDQFVGELSQKYGVK